MLQNQSIGVFDSGVGGTTVLKEILNLLPNENIIYYGDGGNAPYGEKSTEEIQNLCCKILDFFMEKNCKAVVIACNTATAAALDLLRTTYPIPIIGVIAAGAKKAIESTDNLKINVLATPFTVLSKAYVKELEKLTKNISISQEGCPEFCPMIESGWESYPQRKEILKNHISKLSKEADTLILGCTHYPIIKGDIEDIFKGKIIDPAKETASELKELLENRDITNTSKNLGKIDFYVTGNEKNFKIIAEKFLNFKIENIYSIKK